MVTETSKTFNFWDRFVYNMIICDWLWENPPVTHKDNYLEKHN